MAKSVGSRMFPPTVTAAGLQCFLTLQDMGNAEFERCIALHDLVLHWRPPCRLANDYQISERIGTLPVFA